MFLISDEQWKLKTGKNEKFRHNFLLRLPNASLTTVSLSFQWIKISFTIHTWRLDVFCTKTNKFDDEKCYKLFSDIMHWSFHLAHKNKVATRLTCQHYYYQWLHWQENERLRQEFQCQRTVSGYPLLYWVLVIYWWSCLSPKTLDNMYCTVFQVMHVCNPRSHISSIVGKSSAFNSLW